MEPEVRAVREMYREAETAVQVEGKKTLKLVCIKVLCSVSGVGPLSQYSQTRGPRILYAPLLEASKFCKFNLRKYINSIINYFFFKQPKTSFVTIQGQIKSGGLWTRVNCLGLRLILLKKLLF